ncbi:MAG: hypothetical protein A3D90_01865 [Sulfuricurvum sp. RIFCSPHIGHO2_02_FULL_43_9]|nr:MAG: hypothetical protein A3D90_01865 [Sulfuricurvum sp. RIFCSPHIGHO2_02_FULL_43_9]
MQATYHLNTDDLTIDFLESIKTLFKQKTVEISIIDEDEEDFTFAHAIEQGLKSENVSKEELLKALNAS